MKNQQAITIIKELSATEFKRFHSGIKDKYKNDHRLHMLVDYLQENRNQYTYKQLNNNEIYPKIFGEEPYQPNKLSRVMKLLRTELALFLAKQQVEESPFLKEYLLLKAYQKRQYDTLFFGHLKQMKQNLEKPEIISANLWWQKMKLAEEHYYHINSDYKSCYNELTVALDNLDIFYTAAKLKYTCEIVNRNRVLQSEKKGVPALDQVLGLPFISHTIYTNLYAKTIKLLLSPSYDLFLELKRAFIADFKHLNKEESLALFTYLTNHISNEIKQGNQEMISEFIELYELGIESGICLQDGYIDKNMFLNIVDTCCKLNHIDWLENFIKTHSNKIEASVRGNIIQLSHAFIAFSRKQYDSVPQQLITIQSKDDLVEIRIRLLQICSLFELKEFEMVISSCKNLEMYLSRNQSIGKNTKSALKNYVKIVRQLIKPQPNKRKIIAYLDGKNPFIFKKWLLEKVNGW